MFQQLHHNQHGHHGHGQQYQPGHNGVEIKVTIRPQTHPNHYLFPSNDGVRGFNGDFDVRTHASQEQRNEVILTNVGNNLFTIRSATNPNHYLFASDDGARAFGGDYDVRSHASANEERNKWIIEPTNGGFHIRVSTKPNHYLFAANDGSNGYGGDFDVRTHAHQEPRNTWIIDGFFHAPAAQTVTIRVKSHPNHYLFPSNDGTRGLGGDFDVRTHPHQEDRNRIIITRVGYNVYTLQSAVNQNHFFFPSDDGTRAFGGDYDVRTHPYANEDRNKWIIRGDGQGGFLISSFTKPQHFLFAANDGSNALGGDFDVRTHPHQEARNSWIIDNFVLHSY